MKKCVLITSAWNDLSAFSELKKCGFELVFAEDNKDFNGIKSNIFAIVCNSFFLHNDISEFSNLKCIQLTSSGLDRVPLEYIEKNDIKLFNARGVYSIPIAEFALSGLLDLMKDKKRFFVNQAERKWIKNKNLDELYSKNVAIFGCGSVGEEIAKRLKAFGCRVCGYDTKKISSTYFDEILDINTYHRTVANFDILFISMPLCESTRHFCNKYFFSSLKEGSIFVNVARGAIVDESALIEALRTKLFGAVIDVFENEPLPTDSELWNEQNIIITPHNSYASKFNGDRLSSLILRNLKNYV